jgi:hypothetical protein
MWTTFKLYRSKLKGPRYTRGFVSINAKATNEYQEKAALAYLADRHANPLVTGYFQDMGVEIGPNRFGLTELIQWLWRSRIRQGEPKPICLFIPSDRMRTILTNWMLYSDRDVVADDQLLFRTEQRPSEAVSTPRRNASEGAQFIHMEKEANHDFAQRA